MKDSVMPGNPKILNNRKKIDKIDKKVLELLNERAEASLDIRKIKQDLGIKIYDKAREDEVVKQLCKKNKGPLKDKDIDNLFKSIMKTMREL